MFKTNGGFEADVRKETDHINRTICALHSHKSIKIKLRGLHLDKITFFRVANKSFRRVRVREKAK